MWFTGQCVSPDNKDEILKSVWKTRFERLWEQQWPKINQDKHMQVHWPLCSRVRGRWNCILIKETIPSTLFWIFFGPGDCWKIWTKTDLLKLWMKLTSCPGFTGRWFQWWWWCQWWQWQRAISPLSYDPGLVVSDFVPASTLALPGMTVECSWPFFKTTWIIWLIVMVHQKFNTLWLFPFEIYPSSPV